MYNKKCLSTYLFVLALISLFTLIAPFMNVNYIGEVSLALKVLYYSTYVLYIICLVVIIIFGIYNLFKNTFTFSIIQEISAFVALLSLILNLVFFIPNLNAGLSVGYSILIIETFVMACFNNILKLIRKMPTNFRALKSILKTQKEKFEKVDSLVVNEEVKVLSIENEDTASSTDTENEAELVDLNSSEIENENNLQGPNTNEVEIEIIPNED